MAKPTRESLVRSSYHNYSYHKPAPVRVSHVEGFEAPASQYVSPASELDPTLPHRDRKSVG